MRTQRKSAVFALAKISKNNSHISATDTQICQNLSPPNCKSSSMSSKKGDKIARNQASVAVSRKKLAVALPLKAPRAALSVIDMSSDHSSPHLSESGSESDCETKQPERPKRLKRSLSGTAHKENLPQVAPKLHTESTHVVTKRRAKSSSKTSTLACESFSGWDKALQVLNTIQNSQNAGNGHQNFDYLVFYVMRFWAYFRHLFQSETFIQTHLSCFSELLSLIAAAVDLFRN